MFFKNRLVCLFLITKFFVVFAAAQETPRPQTGVDNSDKSRIEYEKKIAEIEAENRRISENNFRIQKALNDGIIAFSIKNYDLAIKKFDEAISLDPDYWGTAPTLLTNKAITLRTVGIEKYKEALKQNLNPITASQQYFFEAVNSLKKSAQILSDNTAFVPDSEKNNFEKYKFNTVKELAECYRLLALTDKTKISEAVEALGNYANAEPDSVKKKKALDELGKLKSIGQN